MEGKTVRIRRIPTETSWGRALEILRIDRARLSVSHLVRAGVTSQSAYRDTLRGPRGPSVWKLDMILRALDCSWWDWARIYEPSNAEAHQNNSNHQHGGRLHSELAGTRTQAGPSGAERTVSHDHGF